MKSEALNPPIRPEIALAKGSRVRVKGLDPAAFEAVDDGLLCCHGLGRLRLPSSRLGGSACAPSLTGGRRRDCEILYDLVLGSI
jgi:hypothetical protein